MSSMSRCCTFTATCDPSLSHASWTCPSDALAIGASANRAKTASTGRPSSSSMRAAISLYGLGGT